MTAGYDDEYYGHCPDNRHEAFEMGVREIAENVRRGDRIRQLKKYPSKVKRELEQLDKVLRKLSLEARSSLWDIEVDTPLSNPLFILQNRIDLAMGSGRKGRSKHDAVRRKLGRDAASLWTTHGADISAVKFVDFLETLIEDMGFGDEGNVRIGAAALAKEMREEFARGDPPRWDHDPLDELVEEQPTDP